MYVPDGGCIERLAEDETGYGGNIWKILGLRVGWFENDVQDQYSRNTVK